MPDHQRPAPHFLKLAGLGAAGAALNKASAAGFQAGKSDAIGASLLPDRPPIAQVSSRRRRSKARRRQYSLGISRAPKPSR